MLARISEGDPLRVTERAARRLRERWVLLELDRVVQRSLAVCAHASKRDEPATDLEVWTLQKVDLAIDQLLASDREAERDHPEELTDEDRTYPLLTEALLIEPDSVRAVTVAFNGLDDLPRRAFFHLCIEGRPVPEVVEAGPWDADGLYFAAHKALAVFGLELPPKKEKKAKAPPKEGEKRPRKGATS